MLLSAKHIQGSRLRATDGEIGHVADLLFDDRSWRVRYLVADTGGWLPGRRVLIAPQAVSVGEEHVAVALTRAQVEAAPAAETDLPVSRQHEADLASHYGWDPWWTTSGDPLDPGPLLLPQAPDDEPEAHGDPHLRSAREVIGYRIHASDGEIGHVVDFLVDEGGWAIRSAVADTGGWRHGHSVALDLGWIAEIDWLESAVHVSVDREAVRGAPAHES